MQTIHLTSHTKDPAAREAYRSLRANLLFCAGASRVILIAGCTDGQDTFALSLNLAASLGEIGKRVIFLDCDLRRKTPSPFGSEPAVLPGLGDILSGQAAPAECVCGCQYAGLELLSFGTIPNAPVELLSTDRFRSLIHAFKTEHDFVIIHGPALTQIMDAAIIAACCDNAILVIHQDKTTRQQAQAAVDQLRKSGCPLLGTILQKQ